MLGPIVGSWDLYADGIINLLFSFRILITGGSSGLVETITDAVSIHSIKKAEYAKRLAQGQLGHVTLLDHFISVRHSPTSLKFQLTCIKSYGDPSSAKFARAQRNFAKSLAGRISRLSK